MHESKRYKSSVIHRIPNHSVYSNVKVVRMIVFGLLLVSLTACLASPTSLDRIIGGRNANIEEVPWQVSVLWDGRHRCGGSIINEFWVLSAAHCFQRDLSLYHIRISSDIPNWGGFVHRIERIVNHPQYDSPVNYANDIALVKVVTPFTFSDRVQPIVIPDLGATIPNDAEVQITGFGQITWLGEPARQLQLAKVYTISQETCRDAYGVSAVTEDMFCAGFPGGGVDACGGDSGGPLVYDGKLYGVVSWGRGCAYARWPGVYARVSYFRQWINQVAGV